MAILKIDDARPTDVGQYTLIGVNRAGSDQTSCKTFVLDTADVDQNPLIDPDVFKKLENRPPYSTLPIEKPEDPSKGKPPKFIVHLPDEVKLYDGDKIHIKCKVEGYPYPEVLDNKKFPLFFVLFSFKNLL
jgi:hypothetical protein